MTRAAVILIALQGYGKIVVLDNIKVVYSCLAPEWPLAQQYWQSGVPSTTVTKIDLTPFGHSTMTGALYTRWC